MVMGEELVTGEAIKKTYSYFYLEKFFNNEDSEHQIGINRFNLTMTKAHDWMPEGVPENYLHKIKAPTNQHTKN